jgi:hypothetical protein
MKKKYKKTLYLIIILLIINTSLTFTLSAETINNTLENDEIDQEQPIINTVEQIYNQTQIAQSFTPTLPKITRIQLFLSKKGEITSDFILIIKDTITGPILTEISIPPENISSTTPEWIEFNFLDINTESEIYYFICKTEQGDQNNYYEIYGDTTNTYKNGIAFTTNNNGSTWLQETNLDFTFKTYGAGPILNIEFIRGLPGGTLRIGLKNTGSTNADNIKITAIFERGLMLNRYFEVKPNISLQPDHELYTELNPIIGFGMTTLDIYVTADNTKRIETQREVFILFLYIYVKP